MLPEKNGPAGVGAGAGGAASAVWSSRWERRVKAGRSVRAEKPATGGGDARGLCRCGLRCGEQLRERGRVGGEQADASAQSEAPLRAARQLSRFRWHRGVSVQVRPAEPEVERRGASTALSALLDGGGVPMECREQDDRGVEWDGRRCRLPVSCGEAAAAEGQHGRGGRCGRSRSRRGASAEPGGLSGGGAARRCVAQNWRGIVAGDGSGEIG
jgi:hypothetical protein